MYDLETAWVAVQLALQLSVSSSYRAVPTLPYVEFEAVRLVVNASGYTLLSNATSVPVSYAAVRWQGPIWQAVDALGLEIAQALAA